MINTADKGVATLAEEKAKEKEERAAIRLIIKSMDYKQLRHIRFYAYGLKGYKTKENIM